MAAKWNLQVQRGNQVLMTNNQEGLLPTAWELLRNIGLASVETILRTGWMHNFLKEDLSLYGWNEWTCGGQSTWKLVDSHHTGCPSFPIFCPIFSIFKCQSHFNQRTIIQECDPLLPCMAENIRKMYSIYQDPQINDLKFQGSNQSILDCARHNKKEMYYILNKGASLTVSEIKNWWLSYKKS